MHPKFKSILAVPSNGKLHGMGRLELFHKPLHVHDWANNSIRAHIYPIDVLYVGKQNYNQTINWKEHHCSRGIEWTHANSDRLFQIIHCQKKFTGNASQILLERQQQRAGIHDLIWEIFGLVTEILWWPKGDRRRPRDLFEVWRGRQQIYRSRLRIYWTKKCSCSYQQL